MRSMTPRLPPVFLVPCLGKCSRIYQSVQHIRRSNARALHSSSCHQGVSKPTHYDTLNLSPNCNQSEIKSQFYALSKTHHPDHNPSDPNAANRFMAISEAYATIGNPMKRQKYDRETLLQTDLSSEGHEAPQGHSGYAGGRKASGLSRRATQFRGPPPSFYRSGGWGAQQAKRAAHQANSESTRTDTGTASGYSGTQSFRQRNAGFYQKGASDDTTRSSAYPFAADSNDVPHFDRDGHFKVQTTLEEQLKEGRIKRRRLQQGRSRQARGRGEGLGPDLADENPRTHEGYDNGPTSTISSFLIVSGLIFVVAGGSVAVLFVGKEREWEGSSKKSKNDK